MNSNSVPHPSATTDIIDSAIPLEAGDAVYTVRHERQKVVASTQASYDGMFAESVQGISVVERLFVALHACRLSKADSLAAHYRERLLAAGADAGRVQAVDSVGGTTVADARLDTMLAFTGKLILNPVEGDRAAIESLVKVGLTTPAIAALGQLIAFLSYQIRVAAGLKAMAAATGVAA